MTRKIIQITTLNSPQPVIVALCDDGTVWQWDASATWFECGPIPQPDSSGEVTITGPCDMPSPPFEKEKLKTDPDWSKVLWVSLGRGTMAKKGDWRYHAATDRWTVLEEDCQVPTGIYYRRVID